MPLAYNAYWTHTPVHSTFAPIKLVHLCARQLQRAIRSTPCSNSAVQLKARCVLRFVPQAAALTESGWLQQLILGTSSPAEASASPKPLSAIGIWAEAQWDATHYTRTVQHQTPDGGVEEFTLRNPPAAKVSAKG